VNVDWTQRSMKAAEPTPKLTKQGAALRKFALTFPDAHEDFPWGHLAVKIGKKAFVFIAAEDGVTSMSAKLPQSKKKALTHSFAAPTEYGLGKHGWVTFTFPRGAELPVTLLQDAITESFRAIAPKRAVKQLDASTATGGGE
jgi:predicted DNA-binding protein (MmcQ/YjbR family)